MRVAFLHPGLGIGGAERLVVDAALALQMRGHRCVIFTGDRDPAHRFEDSRDGGLDVRVHGARLPTQLAGRLRAPCAIARMAWLARAALRGGEHFDVVVCDLVPHVIPLVRRLGSIPVVLYCHYPDLLLAPRRQRWRRLYRAPLDRWEAWATGGADCVLVNSRFTADTVRGTFPSLRVVPTVLHPGVANQPPAPPPSTSETIVALSRLVPEKNLPLALSAYAALRGHLAADAFRRTRLVIAGGYDARRRECAATVTALERAIAQHRLGEQVRLLRSPGDAECRALLSSCRALVYTPAAEPFGYVPIEAMAAGRPVVAANRGGPAETVVDGETGFLCRAEPASFAAALAQLLADPARADRMGAAGRDRIARQFTLERFAAELEAILAATVAAAAGNRTDRTDPTDDRRLAGGGVMR